jgi:predicted GTPase
MDWLRRARNKQSTALNETELEAQRTTGQAAVVVAIMGATGVGKSSFIATITGRKEIVGHDLNSGNEFEAPVLGDIRLMLYQQQLLKFMHMTFHMGRPIMSW